MIRFFPLRHIHNRQSRCKPRTGPKKVFPAGGGGGGSFFAFHPSVALSLALRRIARPFLMGKVCDRGIWGSDPGCVRSDQVEPVRVGQQPTISMAVDPG